jgi:vacuolar protein sorting-associated protein 13A/C
VLISDLHELPVLDMKAPKFTAKIEDWSADVSCH